MLCAIAFKLFFWIWYQEDPRNREGLELNEIHHIPVSNDVSMLGESINTKKKKQTEALLEASGEVGLEY
jgi:hypothetical protein